MSNYSLNVAFTQQQLQTLYLTGSNVIIAKPTGGSRPNVAWQVFKPMQANTLSWTEDYGIYASTSQVTNGARLDQLSNVPVGAAMNKMYTLQPSAVITGPATGGESGSFALLNNYLTQDFMTVGLYQDATVNGTEIMGNAISAVPVLKASTALMTPYTTVYIWLQSQVLSNTVVTMVTSPMTELRFGGEVDQLSIAYDSDSGKFLPAASSRELECSSVLHLEPAL